MNASSRKERERQQRELLFLDTARTLLVENGYLGLKMDDIAAATEYSKGTLYQHFVSKEDMVMGLAVETLVKKVEMFERAAAFNGRSRERMAAIGMASELFMRRYPDQFRIEQIIRADSFREKASPERREKLFSCELRCIANITGIINEAIQQNELILPEMLTPEQLTFGMWSLSLGAQNLMTAANYLGDLGMDNPFEAIINNIHVMLDGIGWHPLTRDWDYEKTFKRVANEIFAEEIEELIP